MDCVICKDENKFVSLFMTPSRTVWLPRSALRSIFVVRNLLFAGLCLFTSVCPFAPLSVLVSSKLVKRNFHISQNTTHPFKAFLGVGPRPVKWQVIWALMTQVITVRLRPFSPWSGLGVHMSPENSEHKVHSVVNDHVVRSGMFAQISHNERRKMILLMFSPRLTFALEVPLQSVRCPVSHYKWKVNTILFPSTMRSRPANVGFSSLLRLRCHERSVLCIHRSTVSGFPPLYLHTRRSGQDLPCPTAMLDSQQSDFLELGDTKMSWQRSSVEGIFVASKPDQLLEAELETELAVVLADWPMQVLFAAVVEPTRSDLREEQCNVAALVVGETTQASWESWDFAQNSVCIHSCEGVHSSLNERHSRRAVLLCQPPQRHVPSTMSCGHHRVPSTTGVPPSFCNDTNYF